MVSVIGPKPSLQWLPVNLLKVDPRYQRSSDRPASQRLIARIAENFHWAKFQAVLATPDVPIGWLLIDGQHRVAAARERGLVEVPAVVIEKASIADQAAAFLGANRDRVPISSQGIFRTRVVAGEPDAVHLQEICDRVGLNLVPYNLSVVRAEVGHTPAVSSLVSIYRLHGPEIAEAAIGVVFRALGATHGALRGVFFLATAKAIADGADAESACAYLSKIGLRGLEHLSYQLTPNSGVAVISAKLLAESKTSTHPKRAAVVDPERKPRGAADGDIAVDRAGNSSEANARQSDPAAGQRPPKPEPAPLLPSRLTPAPFKVGDLPANPKSTRAPKPAKRQPRSSDDEAAIAKFIAEKGSTIVLSPEQIAVFLRDAGYQATIREADPGKRPGQAIRWKAERQAYLDGKPVEMSEFYDVANKLRVAAGLKPVSPPARPA